MRRALLLLAPTVSCAPLAEFDAVLMQPPDSIRPDLVEIEGDRALIYKDGELSANVGVRLVHSPVTACAREFMRAGIAPLPGSACTLQYADGEIEMILPVWAGPAVKAHEGAHVLSLMLGWSGFSVMNHFGDPPIKVVYAASNSLPEDASDLDQTSSAPFRTLSD